MNELLNLVMPPVHPVSVGSDKEWNNIEEKIGINLPEDYKKIVETYGFGSFNEYFYVLNPFIESPRYLNLIFSCEDFAETLNKQQLVSPLSNTHLKPFNFETKKGLMPFIRDEDAGLICWNIDEGEFWNIIVLDSSWSKDILCFEMQTADFINSLLKGSIEIDFYSSIIEEFLDSPTFQKY